MMPLLRPDKARSTTLGEPEEDGDLSVRQKQPIIATFFCHLKVHQSSPSGSSPEGDLLGGAQVHGRKGNSALRGRWDERSSTHSEYSDHSLLRGKRQPGLKNGPFTCPGGNNTVTVWWSVRPSAKSPKERRYPREQYSVIAVGEANGCMNKTETLITIKTQALGASYPRLTVLDSGNISSKNRRGSHAHLPAVCLPRSSLKDLQHDLETFLRLTLHLFQVQRACPSVSHLGSALDVSGSIRVS
ncbi:hypothetical protein B0T13DRAFT_503084 [Neurospora crassa]|nr:hypothetical protein B0T13DRAFT_506664 [Neurospora crassa]KAK3498646.1 hypothetical protein B0T13DRAFT_503084 [Neurospora crassa]